MTEDHIFPKSIAPPTQRQIKLLFGEHHQQSRGRTSKISQKGLTKSNLCGACNNHLLGANYDPALAEFAKELSIQLRNKMFLYKSANLVRGIQLNKVARAACGHILAFDDSPVSAGHHVRALRRYLLRDEALFPSELELFIWLYVGNQQELIRSAGLITEFGSTGLLVLSAMKTYPFGIGFGTITESYKFPVPGVIRLGRALTGDIDQRFDIRINFSVIPDSNWPCAPAPNGAVFTHSDGGVSASPYRNRKPYPY